MNGLGSYFYKIERIRKEYLALLTLTGKLTNEKTKMTGRDASRRKDAEGLVGKFYYHRKISLK